MSISARPAAIPIGQRLSEARNDAGLSKTALLTHLGISYVSLAAYENGRREAPLRILMKAADVLDVQPAWLLLGQGPKNAPATSAFELAVRAFKVMRELSRNASPNWTDDEQLEFFQFCYEYLEEHPDANNDFLSRIAHVMRGIGNPRPSAVRANLRPGAMA